MEIELKITKRNLPHWTLKDSVYFITSKVKNFKISVIEQLLVKEHIINGNNKFYILFALIVMPDHFHVILKPAGEYNLERIMKGIKGASANKINKLRNTRGQLWQDESFDRIIRDENELYEKFLYMFFNPIKANLTEDTSNYHGWYLNEELFK